MVFFRSRLSNLLGRRGFAGATIVRDRTYCELRCAFFGVSSVKDLFIELYIEYKRVHGGKIGRFPACLRAVNFYFILNNLVTFKESRILCVHETKVSVLTAFKKRLDK